MAKGSRGKERGGEEVRGEGKGASRGNRREEGEEEGIQVMGWMVASTKLGKWCSCRLERQSRGPMVMSLGTTRRASTKVLAH
jgi:hypothetical protein